MWQDEILDEIQLLKLSNHQNDASKSNESKAQQTPAK